MPILHSKSLGHDTLAFYPLARKMTDKIDQEAVTMTLSDALKHRFGEELDVPDALNENTALLEFAKRGSCRDFKPDPVPMDLVRTLAAVALCSPTKSDLQQRDIILISDPQLRADLNNAMAGQDWISSAPNLIIFCGNNRRQRVIHDMRSHPFENDHLDAFFNASVDAGVALSAFVLAAEAVGLGCCPISAIRNDPDRVSAALDLPDHVFPVAGLAFGYPSDDPKVSLRLPASATIHENKYDDRHLERVVTDYDTARRTEQPYATQRYKNDYGSSDKYGWSEDKARQYSKPERAGFGDFVRRKGFCLD